MVEETFDELVEALESGAYIGGDGGCDAIAAALALLDDDERRAAETAETAAVRGTIAAVELALAVGVERRPSWARYGDVAVLAELAACSDVPEAPEARRRVGVWRAYCAAEDQRWLGARALAWDDKEAGKARAAECEDHARRLEDRARELAAACAAGEAE